MPVYPGNQEATNTKDLTAQQFEVSTTTHSDLMIMMALLESSKTGERHGRNSPPSPPTVVNPVVPSAQPLGPNFITIGYNDVHRLPTNSDESFLDSWFFPFALVVLLLILLFPAIRLGQACKAKFLAGVQDDYRLQTRELKEAHVGLKQEEANESFDRALPPKIMPYTLSPFQLSPCPSPTVISSSPFSNVDVISLDGEHSFFSPTLQFDNSAATVITTKAEVYVIDGNEGNHTPITTGITNFVEPKLNQIGEGYKSSQRGFLVSNENAKAMPTATHESCLDEESLSMLQKLSSNCQQFSSQYYSTRSASVKNQSPLIGEKTTLRDSGSRRGSLYTGWGKDSKSWGVRHTKSSLARRKVVEMMMATGNVHSHCHYPKTRTSKPYTIT